MRNIKKITGAILLGTITAGSTFADAGTIQGCAGTIQGLIARLIELLAAGTIQG